MHSRIVSFASTLALFPSIISVVMALPQYGATQSSVTGTPPKAVYFQTNNNHGENAIVAMCVGPDGKIGSHKKFPTGGNGCAALSLDGQTIGPDSLFSQHSVIVGGGYLFTVNAGSNTVTMFAIDADTPSMLTQVGEPASTLGDFPVALAYSDELKTLCAANGGKVDGVTCFSVNEDGLTCLDEKPRSLNLGQKSARATGPAGTVSDLVFTPDQKNLMVISKGDTSIIPALPSVIDVYPINENGQIARTCTQSKIEGAQAIYGVASISDTDIFACDSIYGVTKLNINTTTRTVCQDASVRPANDYSNSLRRLAYSSNTGSVYASDFAMDRIVEYDPKTGEKSNEAFLPNGRTGNVDIAIGGDFLYTLSPANPAFAGNSSAIQIINIPQQSVMTPVDTYTFAEEDDITRYAAGLAVYN